MEETRSSVTPPRRHPHRTHRPRRGLQIRPLLLPPRRRLLHPRPLHPPHLPLRPPDPPLRLLHPPLRLPRSPPRPPPRLRRPLPLPPAAWRPEAWPVPQSSRQRRPTHRQGCRPPPPVFPCPLPTMPARRIEFRCSWCCSQRVLTVLRRRLLHPPSGRQPTDRCTSTANGI